MRYAARTTALFAAVAIGALPLAAPLPPRPAWRAALLLAGDGGWCGIPARETPPDPGGQPVHHPTACLAHCARPAPAGDGSAVTSASVAGQPPSGTGRHMRVVPSSPVASAHAATPGARAPPAA